MKRLKNLVLIKLLFVFVIFSVFTIGQGLVYADNTRTPVLASVEVAESLSDLRLPVYAHLQDTAENDYALVIASQEQLDQAGVRYRILDKNARGAEYFILTMLSRDRRVPVDQLKNILLNDGEQVIIRSNFQKARNLAESGVAVKWLGHTPMVVTEAPRKSFARFAVTYDAAIDQMMNQVTPTKLNTYVGNLSGENSVTIGGSSYTITSRNTASGTPVDKATQYVYEFMQSYGLTVSYQNWSDSGYSGRNVVGELTGTTQSDEIVLLTAHLDDMPSGSLAPGADDNASGSVGVMLNAELLSQNQFRRTLRFIVFTGEEQWLLGAQAYSDMAYQAGDNIIAVYNMDMISYDGSGGPDLRLHTRITSNPGYSSDLAIANTFIDVVNAYGLSSNLSPIIDADGITQSDHSAFWNNGYPAILGIEEHDYDITPYYHTTSDTLSTLNMTYFTNFVKASVGTAAHLAIRDDGSPPPAPVADFTANTTNPSEGGTVSFTDTSINTPTSWSWTFAGGTPSTSTAQNPTVTYNTVGTYTVTLTATNSSGSDGETKVDYITVTTAAADEIAEGVDADTLTFTKSGSADWSKVTDVYYNGGDSARSGAIGNSSTTTIETSVTVGSTQAVKFWWKVSSEAGYDYLRFYIDDVEKTGIAGAVDWTQVAYNITAGTHTLKWSYIKDSYVADGSDCGWVDKLEITAPAADPIAEAVDDTSLTFDLSGTGNWFSQTATTYYDGDAAQSADIGNSQSTIMETGITGKTSVKFYWKVSSEAGYDYLRFYIDGVQKDQIAGTVDWTQKTYSVSSGAHTLKWTFIKDVSVSNGSDCGWVDKLELQ